MHELGYARARTADEAVRLRHDAGDGARFIAGGTSLFDLMKLSIERPTQLIDVSEVEGLHEIAIDASSLRFGAAARMSDVADHPVVRSDYPVLAESLSKAASQQLRNMATVGGNLLQRTRCPYFRNGNFYPCNKRNPGSGCAALEGWDRGHALLGASEQCIAVYPGDWAVALVALDASVEILGPSGVRTIPVAELHRAPGTTPHLETTLADEELIVAITVPATAAGRLSSYHKIRDRESYAFALVSVAVALELDGDTVQSARIALGGVATTPWRSPQAEAILTGMPLTREVALRAGRAAFEGARIGRENGFRVELGTRAIADAVMIAAAKGAAKGAADSAATGAP